MVETAGATSSGSSKENSGAGEEEKKDERMFECNICLDTAKDAVISMCGHLFCWPCLHQWLETRPARQMCPVCKAAISKDKVIPLYGRGSSKQEDPRNKAPPRPQGQRTEPENTGTEEDHWWTDPEEEADNETDDTSTSDFGDRELSYDINLGGETDLRNAAEEEIIYAIIPDSETDIRNSSEDSLENFDSDSSIDAVDVDDDVAEVLDEAMSNDADSDADNEDSYDSSGIADEEGNGSAEEEEFETEHEEEFVGDGSESIMSDERRSEVDRSEASDSDFSY